MRSLAVLLAAMFAIAPLSEAKARRSKGSHVKVTKKHKTPKLKKHRRAAAA